MEVLGELLTFELKASQTELLVRPATNSTQFFDNEILIVVAVTDPFRGKGRAVKIIRYIVSKNRVGQHDNLPRKKSLNSRVLARACRTLFIKHEFPTLSKPGNFSFRNKIHFLTD